jgi:hypothetical protein
MQAQDIFNTVVAHLRKQQAKSNIVSVGRSMCVYCSPEGLKCAVGCLITDEEYSPDMETGQGVHALLADYPKIADRLGWSNRELLESLQLVHDHYQVERWEDGLQSVATYYDLTYTPPQ